MSSSHNHYLTQASHLALHSVKLKGGPFGAVIVKDGKVIGKGHNVVTLENDPTAHAEIMAIRRACQTIQHFSLKDSIIYTSCEPCPMCLAACYWANISEIYYANTREKAEEIGFNDSWIYLEIGKNIQSRSISMIHMPNDIATKAFFEWSVDKDKRQY